jgi:predicted DNA-binding transcriptional regulator AlpA
MAGERTYRPVYVSAETLAYLLDCSPATIAKYSQTGLLPKPIMLGNLVRWEFGAVMAFIAASNGEAAVVEDEFLKAVKNASA